jgi:K+:H+ antiporter
VGSSDFVQLVLQLAILLGTAVVCGQAMRALRQPAVLGEMIGGVLLGPTLLGALLPQLHQDVFHSPPAVSVARDSFTKLGMLFFLFVAGLETDLSDLRRRGRQALSIGLVGTLLPIGAGLALVYASPAGFWGAAASAHPFALALFVGMSLANSANPVLARILMDLGLLRGSVGTLCMAATIVDDLVNWALFAVILSEIAPSGGSAGELPWGLARVALLFVTVLGLGRWLGPHVLHWLRQHVAWPSGFIAMNALVVLAAAGASERLGTHAFLGAFLAGAALGGHDPEHRQAHDVITRFSLSFFAPIYFVSMGLFVDFRANFDAGLVLAVLAVALVSKLAAVLLGARLAGLPIDRQAWAIAFGLNARGATGLILAGVGRETGVIDDRIFVALAVMAVVTSLMAGPAMSALLGRQPAAAGSAPAAGDATT